MNIEKLIHQLNDIRKRLSADNADAIAYTPTYRKVDCKAILSTQIGGVTMKP
jgi:hypothetical protein